ncbi:hypothetical protein EON64_20205, partial [archaeon]
MPFWSAEDVVVLLSAFPVGAQVLHKVKLVLEEYTDITMSSLLNKSGVSDSTLVNSICKEWEDIRSNQLTPHFVLLQQQQRSKPPFAQGSRHSSNDVQATNQLTTESTARQGVEKPSKPTSASSLTQTSSLDMMGGWGGG